MVEIGECCAQSNTAITIDEAVAVAEHIGYPVIVRAAYALGGLGPGLAQNKKQLQVLCSNAFATSPQVLIEKSMKVLLFVHSVTCTNLPSHEEPFDMPMSSPSRM